MSELSPLARESAEGAEEGAFERAIHLC